NECRCRSFVSRAGRSSGRVRQTPEPPRCRRTRSLRQPIQTLRAIRRRSSRSRRGLISVAVASMPVLVALQDLPASGPIGRSPTSSPSLPSSVLLVVAVRDATSAERRLPSIGFRIEADVEDPCGGAVDALLDRPDGRAELFLYRARSKSSRTTRCLG